MNMTPEQEAFIASWNDGDSIRLDCFAGGGKTTSLVAAMRQGDHAVAFSKLIAKDLEPKLPPGATCGTLSSLSYRMTASHLGRSKLDLDPSWRHLYGVLDSVEKNWQEDYPDLPLTVKAAMNAAYVPDGLPGSPQPGEPWSSVEIFAGEQGFDPAPEALVAKCIDRGLRLAWKGSVDFLFADYFAALYASRALPRVLIDEAQDVSPLQLRLLTRLHVKQLCAIGDPHQSIFAFRGADPQAMNRLEAKFSLKRLRLTVCFRCDEAIVREAQAILPDIRWRDGAPLGTVEHVEGIDLEKIQDGTTILCRNNAPLIGAAFALIKSGRPAKVLGRDIGSGILSFLKKAVPSGDVPLKDALDSVSIYAENRAIALRAKGRDVDSIYDRRDCILTIAGEIKKASPKARDLVSAIESIFDDSTSPVILSSIHKAKGREWDKVYLLRPSLIGKYASTETQQEQEQNLRYVAVTRAKHSLTYVKE